MAHIAKLRGLEVTLVCSSPYILRRIFTPEMSDMYMEFFKQHGVEMLMGLTCTNILVRHGHVTGVRLCDGTEMPADMVVIGCGVRPNIDLFRDQLALEHGTKTPGILVDPYLLTSVPGVYAIGDVAAMRFCQHNPGAMRHYCNAKAAGTLVTKLLLAAAKQIEHVRSKSIARDPAQGLVPSRLGHDKVLVPASTEITPYVPHPSYDVAHFGFRGYVSGDRLGPDFVMIGERMDSKHKLVTFWLWENRVVGAFVSDPSDEEKALLDQATSEQWYIQDVPTLRHIKSAHHAIKHVRQHHCP
eukprot:c18404_g1_i1.p1 GENE.c18404_g1_i1~~c18404_g1_i1.p1  ORF type:complete len:299 (+),score=49.08 c18404_g1_i1:332-1228(+)